ncbi:MAG: ATP-binding protein [Angustibacter sp.]
MSADDEPRRAGSMRSRLLTAFTVVGLLVVGSAAAGVLVIGSSSSAVTDVARAGVPLQRANAQLRDAATGAAADLRGYLISGDRRLLTDLGTRWDGYAPALTRARAACPQQPGACALLARSDAAAQRWYTRYAAPVAAGRVSRTTASDQYATSRAQFSTFSDANTQLTALVEHQIDDALRQADRQRQVGRWLLVASTLLAVVCLVALAWLTVRQVVPPLTALRDVLRRLAAGDLEARMPVRGPSEMQAVAVSVNRLAEQSLRLRDAEFDRAQVRGLTRDLDRRMRQHLHGDAVAEEVVGGVGAMVHADRVHVRFIEGGRMGGVAAQWATRGLASVDSAPPGPTHPLESAGAVASRGHQSLAVDDVDTYLQGGPAGTGGAVAARAYAGAGPMVVAPVLVGQERIGVLVCARAAGRPRFDAAEVGLIETVAGDLARAVHHARLFEQQNTVVGQLRELDRTKSDFLSTISHELRTPLTSIAGYVEMMRDGDAGELQPMQDNMLEIVGRNTQRLRDLIEDVLMISKVEAGAVRSERLPVALAGVVDHVVTSLRPQADAAGVSIDAFPVPAEAVLLGDHSQIDRMLLNLVGNAIKFTPRRGRVSITVQVTGDDVVVQVQDTGIGIPAGEIASLFTRFYRASNATQRQIPGTGLGLVIIAGIVAAHDGQVEVDSVEGTGTTFTVTLPRLDVSRGTGQQTASLRF